jgi:outer membrane protein assembly factor BamB
MRGGWGAVRAVAVGAAALALAGCWPAPGQGPDRQSNNPFETTITVDSVASLAEDWSADLGEVAAGAPIVSPAGVHAQGGSVLHTLAPSDGAERWTFDPEVPAPVGQMSDPVWQDGQVFAGYGYGNLGGHWEAQSLDATTGAPARTLGGGLVNGLRGARLVQSSVGFGSGGPIAVSLSVQGDLDDPATRWTGTMQFASFGGSQITHIPATAGTRGVYHVGQSLVTTTPGPEPATAHGIRMYSYDRPPSCYTGGSSPLFLPCPSWATPLDGSSATPPVIGPGDETVYTGTNVGTVYAIDAATGAVRWQASAGAAVTASPALVGGTLFVPTADGDLVAMAAGGCGAATCDPLWAAPAGDALTVQPAAAGGVVFTGAADGSVHAFPAAGCGAATCGPLWSASTGSRVTGAPAVSNGRLYVGTNDGRIVAYAPS